MIFDFDYLLIDRAYFLSINKLLSHPFSALQPLQREAWHSLPSDIFPEGLWAEFPNEKHLYESGKFLASWRSLCPEDSAHRCERKAAVFTEANVLWRKVHTDVGTDVRISDISILLLITKAAKAEIL